MDLARDLERKDLKRDNEGSLSEKQSHWDEISQIKLDGDDEDNGDCLQSVTEVHSQCLGISLELEENPVDTNKYQDSAGPRGTSKHPTEYQASFFDRKTTRRHHM